MTRNDVYTAAVILTIPAVMVAASWCALRARRLFDRWVEIAADRVTREQQKRRVDW